MHKENANRPGEPRKGYRKPELKSTEIELGVFGDYQGDPGGPDEKRGRGEGLGTTFGGV